MINIEHRDPDVDLVQKAKQGDSYAFSALYEKYINNVYGFIYAKVGSRQDAEDITQITFTKMLQSLRGFSGKSTFKTWLYSLARNATMDYWRDHYKNNDVPIEDFLRSLEVVNQETDFKDQKKKEELVEKTLERLNDNQRDVLKLRFLKGYSIKETAQELRLSESNVKVLQYRALKKAAQDIDI